MGENTNIEWAHHTFSPWWGCTKVKGDPACANCYAESWSKRWGEDIWGADKQRRIMGDGQWRKPVQWDRSCAQRGVRERVFCASMSDIFEDRRDLDAPRERMWALIDATPHLDWLLLTKRPENFWMLKTKQRDNVWLGVTAATQRHWDERVPILNEEDCAQGFVSMEPMLEHIDMHLDQPEFRVDWLIVGGESGARARPMDPAWAQHAMQQCMQAGIPFFFKQWGGKDKKAAGRLLHGRTWDQVPS